MTDTAEKLNASRPKRNYRLFVNEASTVLVTIWHNGSAEVARRDHPSDVWGPPIVLKEEK
jgi:hypothetical protein